MDNITLGKYTLIETLGQGGYGTVYKAKDGIGRTVAVKILKPVWADDIQTIERFRREARATGELFHPRIATILDFDEIDGRLFLVMRYIDGPSLDHFIDQRGSLPWDESLAILQDTAEGLDYAHKRGFIHRDVKPANIMVSPEEGAVLTDFGLVSALQFSGISTSGVMLGTPNYIAPEIWQGEAASPATDVYSLACVFYEMLTGQKLFSGDSAPQIMTKHILQGPLFASQWALGTPQGAEVVLQRALSQKALERFASAGEFATALLQLGNQPAFQSITQPEIPVDPQPIAIAETPIPAPISDLNLEVKDASVDLVLPASLTQNPELGSATQSSALPIKPTSPPPIPAHPNPIIIEEDSHVSAQNQPTATQTDLTNAPHTGQNKWQWFAIGGVLVLLIFLLVLASRPPGTVIVVYPSATSLPAIASGATPSHQPEVLPKATATQAPVAEANTSVLMQQVATKTISPTITKTYTDQPSSGSSIIYRVKFAASAVYLRAGPDSRHPILAGPYPAGEEAVVDGRYQDKWFLIHMNNGSKGWISTDWAAYSFNISSIPLISNVSTPPVYTPTPTKRPATKTGKRYP